MLLNYAQVAGIPLFFFLDTILTWMGLGDIPGPVCPRLGLLGSGLGYWVSGLGFGLGSAGLG